MKEKLRVMLIDEEPGRAALLERALLDAGYDVTAKITTTQGLLARVVEVQPDVIIIDMESPDRDTLEQMRTINHHHPRPVVMFAENSDSGTIEAAVRAGVHAYVVDGLNAKRVKPIMDVAMARFREYQALKQELAKTKLSLAERKVIDKAKGILITQRGWNEDQAYKALRKMAMDQNKRIAEVAENLVAMAKLLKG